MKDIKGVLLRAVLLVIALTAPALVAGPENLTPEQRALIEETRQVAMNYSNWLPDLICTEYVQREIDWNESGNFVHLDNLKAQVTYFDRKESYKLIGRRGKLETLTGAISEGEFGSILRNIFDPDAKAEFEWKGVESLRQRKMSAFTYRVDEINSRLKMTSLAQSAFVGFHGTVYIDDDTKMVLALTVETVGPDHFPIRDSRVAIEYDWAGIAGHQYLVPSRAEVRLTENAPAKNVAGKPVFSSPLPNTPVGNMPVPGKTAPPGSCIECDPPGIPAFNKPKKEGRELLTKYRNLIEFKDYKKFTADSKLTFDGK